jgi:hypothetical protein
MRRGDGEKRGRCEDGRVDYFCHRVFNKYFILHFTFSILHLGNFSGWEKEKIMNRGRRGMTLKEYNEILKMGRWEDVKM